MIVPMKKVSLVILEKDKSTSLKKLRKLGVVHLERLEGAGEELATLKETEALCINALSVLEEVKVSKDAQKRAAKLEDDAVLSLVKKVNGNIAKKKALFDEVASNTAELERLCKWGKVDPDDFAYLKQKGIDISLYEVPTAVYGNMPQEVKTVRVSGGNKKEVLFALLNEGEGRHKDLPPEAYEVMLPRASTDELSAEIARDKAAMLEADKQTAECAVHTSSIRVYMKKLSEKIEFENVRSGMFSEGADGASSLAWVSGYVPADGFDALKKCAANNGWALASSDPAEEDNPPTKLRNNKLVSMIYPLTDFLGTVPGYREFDISGWFLLFFAIFFGMIFGDAGYGLLIVCFGLGFIAGTKKGGGQIGPGHGLLVLLGLTTMIWGTVTCTWFGLSMDKIPDVLKRLSVPPLSNAYVAEYANKPLTTDSCLQIFCFSLAFLQLSIAHLTCIAAHSKTVKWLGDLGSLLMLWGMFYIVLMLVVSGEVFSLDKTVILPMGSVPIGKVAIGCIGTGFVLSFVFSNYEGNVAKSILESTKNIISVILGVVNVFSDIVSYIRLWAVALAGSAISNTVNTMAGPMWGKAAMFIAFVLLLVFGHGLNMILNVLSVIVHGVRLNTLEFSSHLGMAWSGYKYEPFRETAR